MVKHLYYAPSQDQTTQPLTRQLCALPLDQWLDALKMIYVSVQWGGHDVCKHDILTFSHLSHLETPQLHEHRNSYCRKWMCRGKPLKYNFPSVFCWQYWIFDWNLTQIVFRCAVETIAISLQMFAAFANRAMYWCLSNGHLFYKINSFSIWGAVVAWATMKTTTLPYSELEVDERHKRLKTILAQ